MSGSARERLLEAASDLFYHEGITTTGIDRVIARAQVAKASLYNNFASKDDLVTAYLEVELARVEQVLAALPRDTVGGATLALFDDLAAAAQRPDFVGCPFLNAAVELGGDAPARRVIDAFVARLAGFFLEDLAGDGARATQLLVCYQGAMAAQRLTPGSSLVRAARDMAHKIVEAARARTTSPTVTSAPTPVR